MLVKRLAAYIHLSSTVSEICKLLVENCDIFTLHLCLAAPQGVTLSEFREDLDTNKTRMNGLSCGEESMTMFSRFDTIPNFGIVSKRLNIVTMTDGRTDRQTDGRPAYSYYVLQHS